MNKTGKMINFILAVTVATSMGSIRPIFVSASSTSKVSTVSQSVSKSHRLAGANRYTTAVAISQKGWATSGTVILASGEDYADALTSGPLAKKYNAPILLTSKASINADTIAEIGRLKAKHIIIIGKEGAVSLGVATQLTKAGFSNITRIGGVNRYETSTLVAAKLNKPSAVVIVPGQDFPDALSVSSIASKLGLSIILSAKSGLSDSAKKYISTNEIKKAYIVGGTAVLSPAIEKQVTGPVRLAGVNRYETNLAILKAFDGEFNYDNVFIATGNNFADALAGAALSSKTSSPMILSGCMMNTNIANYLASKENLNTKILALGGEAVISNSIIKSAIDDKATISVAKNYSSAGTYSDAAISGSVIISAAAVNLKNTTISGDLLIASTVGEGNVDLDNVTVTGKIIINGGGLSSVKLHNMHSKSVELDKAIGESVRVATDATSSIDTVLVSTSGIVDQTFASEKGSIIVDNNSSVVLKGGFDTVQVNGRGSIVKVVGGSIATLNVNTTSSNTIVDVDVNSAVASIAVNNNVSITGTGAIVSVTVAKAGVNVNLQATSVGTVLVSAAAVGSEVNISSATTVANLNVNAAAIVSGAGIITNANIGANGTTIAITPVITAVAAGVSAVVNGTIFQSAKIADMRIVLATDVHYDSNLNFNTTKEDKANLFIKSLNDENKDAPIDMVFILGDIFSTPTPNPPLSYTWWHDFVENYLPQLDMPYYVIKGNHDAVTDAQWASAFSYPKNYTVVTDEYAFICLNSYGGAYNGGPGDYHTPVDVTWINAQLAKLSNKKVFILSHYVDPSLDPNLVSIINANSNIVCAFDGHGHLDTTTNPSGGKPVFMCGQFSAGATKTTGWCYRNLELRNNEIKTEMIYIAKQYPLFLQPYSVIKQTLLN